MGWHYTLEVECKVLPEFSYFFEREYLREISDSDDIYILTNIVKSVLKAPIMIIV